MAKEDILTAIDDCMDLDQKVLQNSADSELMKELVRKHLDLSSMLNDVEDSEVNVFDIPDEMKKQILSEKQLLPLFGAKGDYETVTLLTTFTCFLMSRSKGEQMHSGKYMSDVKKIHELVNSYYGRDPKTARSCS